MNARALALMLALAGCGGAADDAGAPDAAPTADYLLFAPLASTTTYLIDRDGQVVHTWAADTRPGHSVYLLDGGHLLRTEVIPSTVFSGGGTAGRVTEYDWDGNVVWTYDYASATHHSHHDVTRMPDGHVLMIAWEAIPDDAAIARGRDPATLPADGDLWVDHVVELDPATGAIVWEWHLWDHPEIVDVNFAARPQNDWTHINSIAYEPARDQILLSVHNLNEIWIVDHGTGELVYRWGNPAAYDAGTAADQQLFGQHNAHWIADDLPGAGNILLFNNGNAMTRRYSTVDELAPSLAADGAPSWRYAADPPEAMFASSISGAQRLPGGNTLVCVGPEGRFLEVTAAGETVWTYQYPGAMSAVFRVTSYPADHPGLVGRDLTPRGPIE